MGLIIDVPLGYLHCRGEQARVSDINLILHSGIKGSFQRNDIR